MRWRKLRPAVQVVALLLFVVLMLAAGRGALPADLFFRIDPLAGLAGMLAGRRLIPAREWRSWRLAQGPHAARGGSGRAKPGGEGIATRRSF